MKVMTGVSGGVDSATAALLLVRQGHAVEGLFMQNWDDDEGDGPCSADVDRKDAVAVCARLGIPFHARNFASEYWGGVFEHFLSEYRRGRTPNPDVLCNREIKFKTFLDEARSLGAEKIATGHYARIAERDSQFHLLRAVDTAKDQSYFLHALGQDQLAFTMFPIGALEKTDVRRTAREAGLSTHAKKDSTGICFIGERDFRAFLGRYIPARPGPIQTPTGSVLGEHQGALYYTLGQRQGLGLGGRAETPGEPWYVVGKKPTENVLYVAQGGENRWLQSRRLRATDLTWIAGAPPATEFPCTAKCRYRQPDQACHVTLTETGCEVTFEHVQRAVTPGQSVVFYTHDECLGGGVIDATDAVFGGLTGS